MADKMDLSLDDIIKINRKNNAGQRGKAKQQGKPTQRLRNLGLRSGITRPRGGPKQQQLNRQQTSPNKSESSMLHVSNLHFKVTDVDVKELFEEIGPLKKAAVHYDASGRSLGTAEVIYKSRADAISAIKTYNQRALDGRPMSITLVPTQTGASAKSRISGVKPNSGISKRPQMKTNNPRGGTRPTQGRNHQINKGNRKPNQHKPKKEVTAEQLDADLEAYTMHTD